MKYCFPLEASSNVAGSNQGKKMSGDNADYCYRTITGTARVRLAVGACRFVGSLASVSSTKSAQDYIHAVMDEFPDATHHTFAYRLGVGSALEERYSDAREPAGSAGPPLLQQLRGAGVSDVVLVASRWFGGVKLGLGGLTRAYRSCARACLEQAKLVEKEGRLRYRLEAPYDNTGILFAHIEGHGGTVLVVDYTAHTVIVETSIPQRKSNIFEKEFHNLTRGRGGLKMLPEEKPDRKNEPEGHA